MNHPANKMKHWLRSLGPFVTLRQAHDMVDVINELAKGVDGEVHTLVNANNLICNRLDALESTVTELIAKINYYKTVAINNYAELAVEVERLKSATGCNTWQVTTSKKPSRKKPAKKRGGAKA